MTDGIDIEKIYNHWINTAEKDFITMIKFTTEWIEKVKFLQAWIKEKL
jgi:hypothetical protein